MGTGREGEGDIREGGGGSCKNKNAIGIPQSVYPRYNRRKTINVFSDNV